MEKSSVPTVEERGLFRGLGTPPSLNAILLAFVGIVFFVAGAKGIDWALTKWSPQKCTYERFVWAVRNKVVNTFPVTEYFLDGIFIPITFVRSESIVHNDLFEKLRKDGITSVEEFEKGFKLPWWVYLIYGFWFVVVWGLFAGAVNRIYAYRIGRDESITIREAMSYAFKTWGTHIFSAILLAVFVAVIFWAAVLGVFVFGKIPYISYPGQVLLIPGFFLVIIASFIIGFIVTVLVFAFDLISSAIAVERTDPFDAISRAYAYVTERPWHTLLYTGLAGLFVMFFLWFGSFALGLSEKILSIGLGSAYEPIHDFVRGIKKYDVAFGGQQVTLGWLGAAVWGILWVMRVFILATAGALWLASRTKSYLLLRQEIDGDDTDEIYIEEEELVEEKPITEKKEEKAEEKKEEAKGEVKEEKKEEKSSEEKKDEEKK